MRSISAVEEVPVSARDPLETLGFDDFFRRQVPEAQWEHLRAARVVELQRETVTASDGRAEVELAIGGRWFQLPPARRPTVGDWVMLDAAHSRIERLLERKSVLARIAPGGRDEVQVIAANVEVLFIVTSCNEEFNRSRLERYLALALEAGIEPVIVLTKADQCDAPETFARAARTLRQGQDVECVNAREPDSLHGVRRWCVPGRTVALVGSSGVGKSTLVNTLAGREMKSTAPARASDARGRHTTSYRALHVLPGGALLLDVPGIRELRIADAEAGLARMFEDVEALAARCRFSDCSHLREPGCAVLDALASGELDARRLQNYRKLREEQAHAMERLARRTRAPRRRTRSKDEPDGS
jgi:ribosome biogenesis GTPase / thiamine phosphate phosphatase